MTFLVRAVALLGTAALLVGGCATPTSGSPGPALSTAAVAGIPISATPGVGVDRQAFPPVSVKVKGVVDGLPGEGIKPYLGQKLRWRTCAEATMCAEVLAPMDYQHPAKQAVTIALRRKPATKKPHLGTLFINPGGPGASGKELVSDFLDAGLEQYDLLGWDPRGSGDSTPVSCLTDDQADAFLNLDASPDDQTERAAWIKANFNFGKACWERNGELLNHIGTIETVRDLDLLRQLVGEGKLNFFGYSYGTEIGATYAELYGSKTGRLVLDAAVNITDDDSVIQAQGFDLALNNFAKWCAEDDCGLGDTKQQVLSAVTGLFDELDAKPLPVGSRLLTQSLASSGVALMLYGGREAWEPLATVVDQAINGEGEHLLRAADQINARNEDGSYGRLFFAFPAISCLDSKEDGVLDADRLWIEDQVKAPIFGKYFGPQYTCPMWPTQPSAYSKLKVQGAEAAPLMVIGGLGDNATPYQFAQSMAKQLKSAVLVTYTGEGHGSYGGKSTCIDQLVVRYLVKGKLPAGGTKCG